MASGADGLIRLNVRIDGGGLDDAQLADLTRSLRREIDRSGLSKIAEAPDPSAPSTGAKGDALTFGVLLIEFGPVVIEQVLTLFREWVGRPGARPIKITVREGDREISAEFDAASTNVDEVRRIAEQLRPAAS